MAKKKSLPELPELPADPLDALETFNSMVTRFQKAVDTIGDRLGEIDRMAGDVDQRFSSTPTISGFVARATPKSHTHLSYEGQSELSYCIECCQKHSQTAKVLIREAIQRAQAGSPSDPGVMEKVRGAVEEMVGFEDDSDTVKNEKVTALNTMSRNLRKLVYTSQAEIGGASIKDLREIKDKIDKLVDASYQVRKSEEWCPGCDVEEICGGNLECIEFMERAARSVKDPEEWERFLEEAKRKYGRG